MTTVHVPPVSPARQDRRTNAPRFAAATADRHLSLAGSVRDDSIEPTGDPLPLRVGGYGIDHNGVVKNAVLLRVILRHFGRCWLTQPLPFRIQVARLCLSVGNNPAAWAVIYDWAIGDAAEVSW